MGERVAWPAEIVDLHDIRPEVSVGQFRPDITARDRRGELLIEIRVSHAVDDAKAVAVRQGGHRMIEIDLSRLARDTLFDTESFKNQVLFSEANRTWISLPAVEDAWKLASDRVKALAANESAENRILGANTTPNVKERTLSAPAPASFRLEETKPMQRSESDDPNLYSRVGTTTRQPDLGCGVILSRATRVRPIYRVQFECGVRYILFREDETDYRF